MISSWTQIRPRWPETGSRQVTVRDREDSHDRKRPSTRADMIQDQRHRFWPADAQRKYWGVDVVQNSDGMGSMADRVFDQLGLHQREERPFQGVEVHVWNAHEVGQQSFGHPELSENRAAWPPEIRVVGLRIGLPTASYDVEGKESKQLMDK